MYYDLAPGQTATVIMHSHLLGTDLSVVQFAINHPDTFFVIAASAWIGFQYLLWKVERYRLSFAALKTI